MLMVPIIVIVGLSMEGATTNEVFVATVIGLVIAGAIVAAAIVQNQRRRLVRPPGPLDVPDRRRVQRAVAQGKRVDDVRLASVAVLSAQEVERTGWLSVVGIALAIVGGMLSFDRLRDDTALGAVAFGFIVLIVQVVRTFLARRSASLNRALIGQRGSLPDDGTGGTSNDGG